MKAVIRRNLFYILMFITGNLIPSLATAQGFPDGEGRDAFLAACSACHALTRITDPHRKLTAEEWEFHLYDMISRGAPVYEKDIEPIRRYLIENFSAQ
jgi:hypothetical protein